MPTNAPSSTAAPAIPADREAAALPGGAPGSLLRRHVWTMGFLTAIAAGAALRLIWLADIEYKWDEAWVVTAVDAFWQTHVIRPVGIPSSAGLPHPGLNLWVFILLSAVLPSAGPLELTRVVQVLNVVALVLLAVFVHRAVDKPEREPWLWAVALWAVNPLAVLFGRKLWAQDLLPLFTLALLAGWWHRRFWWGAFLWGLAGALLGQVHLCGFLFSAAFLGVVLLFDRASMRWAAWLGGSALGAIPLVPWLLTASRYAEPQQPLQLNSPLIAFGDWINFSLGIDLNKSLGDDFPAFLAFPKIGGWPSHTAAALMIAVVLLFVVLVARFLARLRRERRSAASVFFSSRSSTNLAINAAFFGYCTLLFLVPRPVFMHYMIVTFCLPALWLAWIAQHGSGPEPTSQRTTRRLLAALVTVQAALTLVFLAYIHDAQVIRGDYGTAFGSQTHPP